MRKVISVILFVTMMVTMTLTVSASNQKVQLGDYVKFGEYDNTAIIWQVIDIDRDGIMTLYSTKILDYMVFDSAEGGIAGEGEDQSQRFAYGSNDYANSNVHEWLNSGSYPVLYSTGEPNDSSVLAYTDFEDVRITGVLSDQPGFLNEFSAKELSALEESTYTVGTPYLDGGFQEEQGVKIDIGTVAKVHSTNLRPMMSKVFLLSLNEWVDYVKNNDFDRLKEYVDGPSYYWLRTPDEQSETLVATIDSSGDVFKTTASYAQTGVVPALKLNVLSYPILSGDGTSDNPYELDLMYADFVYEDISESLRTSIAEKLQVYKSKWLVENDFMAIEQDVRGIEGLIRSALDQTYMKAVYDVVADEIGLNFHRHLFINNNLLIKDAAEALIFNDLAELTVEQKTAISELSDMGIVNGYVDGSFKPSKSVTRAEMAKMITLLVQKDDNILTKSFADVAYGDWFFNYVANAKDWNLIRGYGDGTYLPNNTVSKDELSVIVARVLKYQYGYDGAKTVDSLDSLASGSSVASWASEDVALLIDVDVITEGELHLGYEQASRLEVVTMLDRLKVLIYE